MIINALRRHHSGKAIITLIYNLALTITQSQKGIQNCC